MYRRGRMKDTQMNLDRIAGNRKQFSGVAKRSEARLRMTIC